MNLRKFLAFLLTPALLLPAIPLASAEATVKKELTFSGNSNMKLVEDWQGDPAWHIPGTGWNDLNISTDTSVIPAGTEELTIEVEFWLQREQIPTKLGNELFMWRYSPKTGGEKEDQSPKANGLERNMWHKHTFTVTDANYGTGPNQFRYGGSEGTSSIYIRGVRMYATDNPDAVLEWGVFKWTPPEEVVPPKPETLPYIDGVSIDGVQGVISNTEGQIHVQLPVGYDRTALTPVFTLPEGGSITPEGARDFTTPQKYTVTSPDGEATQEFTFTITEPNLQLLGEERPIKVFSLGCSITRGAFEAAQDAYPARLQAYLNAHYGAGSFEVYNGGKDGYGAVQYTQFQNQSGYYPDDRPGQEHYAKLLAWQPDVIIYMIGPNDTKAENWYGEDIFVEGYRALLDTCLKLDSKPMVLVATSTPFDGGRDEFISGTLARMQRETAQYYGMDILEVNGYFHSLMKPIGQNGDTRDPNGSADGLYNGEDHTHLSKHGYDVLGKYFSEQIIALKDALNNVTAAFDFKNAEDMTVDEENRKLYVQKAADDFSLTVTVAKGVAWRWTAEDKLTITAPNGDTAVWTVLFDETPPKPEPETLGDIDGNGKIDTTDARLALQYAVEKITLTEEQLLAGDVDASDKVDTTDARLILQYAVEKIDKFPAEK